jgi:crotonobetainyl-CoA:carnitine CoA-transferase CaiB-like acyl-CoA transferase
MNKLGLDYDAVKEINPKIVYAEITGYGKEGPWKHRPGQDLLLQSLSGLVYTSGNADDDPVPFGIAIADIICGAHLVQGILAALIRRHKRGVGALIEVSLLESLLDFQFELLTTYYTSGELPKRSNISNGHPLLSAPYGLYATKDGFIAIAMVNLQTLANAIQCEQVKSFNPEDSFSQRDIIKTILSDHLATMNSEHWLQQLHKAGIWSMEVMDWRKMKDHEAYKVLKMEQEIITAGGKKITTTRCPIRINGERLVSDKPAPQLGADREKILNELFIKAEQ